MNIIITLDYELYLNDYTGTPEMCLVKPMQELHRVCEMYNVKLTVFVDAAYLYKLFSIKNNSIKAYKDYEITVDNIKWLVDKGHDIQLHIHPQWYYSSYKDSGWELDWEHYKLSDMDKDYAFEMFKKSKELLDSIIGYKTTLFRAGGYSIQEFEYVECFKQNGIIVDSSVLPGNKVRHKTHSYDYTNVSFDVYRFEDNIAKYTARGSYWEFPICSSKKVFITKYLRKKKKWMSRTEKNWGDGGNRPICGKMAKIKTMISSFSLFKHIHGTIDYQSYFWLEDIYQFSKKYKCMTIIGHPKNFSPSTVDFIEKFIKEKQSLGDKFITITQYIKQNNS